MTLLVSWIGVDQRGPASVYIASDSRLSWKLSNTTYETWDFGKKVFAFKNSPDLIGYCGDVLFPTQVLSQIVDIGDRGLLFNLWTSSNKKFEIIKYKIRELFDKYPKHKSLIGNNFSIIYATRQEEKSLRKDNFHCYHLNWSKQSDWNEDKVDYLEYSDKVFVLGSGAKDFKKRYDEYWKSKIKKTSRAIFQCFCDTLRNSKEKTVGGAPQLVGLYRVKNGQTFGIVYNKKKYLNGVNAENLINFENVEWRNELFERYDGKTKKIIKGAAKQPRPKLE